MADYYVEINWRSCHRIWHNDKDLCVSYSLFSVFINAQDSSDNLIGAIRLTDGIDWLIKIRTGRMCQLFTSCFVTRISTNQTDEDWNHAPDSCSLEVFLVSPKREFAHFYLAVFKIITGIYEW